MSIVFIDASLEHCGRVIGTDTSKFMEALAQLVALYITMEQYNA